MSPRPSKCAQSEGECPRCKQMKPLINNKGICQPCSTARVKEWRQANPEKYRAQGRRRYHMDRDTPQYKAYARIKSQRRVMNLRAQVIEAYGGAACACCGETQQRFLTIDHVNNDGAAHRRSIGGGSHKVWAWLKRNNYPSGFQVLCMNCNFGKAQNGGICPHAQNRLHELVQEDSMNSLEAH